MLDLLLVNPGNLLSQFGGVDMLKKKIGRDYEKTNQAC